MTPSARSPQQRKQDTLRRLEQDIDAWVATADGESGTPYLIPLSFLWDGTTLLFATPATSPTLRNIQATGRVRIGVGLTRDVILIEGTVETLEASELANETGDAFAAKTGFDPRESSGPYLYFCVTPQRLQAWREANELEDRDLMREGCWLIPD
jgi:hypothetical protein